MAGKRIHLATSTTPTVSSHPLQRSQHPASPTDMATACPNPVGNDNRLQRHPHHHLADDALRWCATSTWISPFVPQPIGSNPSHHSSNRVNTFPVGCAQRSKQHTCPSHARSVPRPPLPPPRPRRRRQPLPPTARPPSWPAHSCVDPSSAAASPAMEPPRRGHTTHMARHDHRAHAIARPRQTSQQPPRHTAHKQSPPEHTHKQCTD